MSGDPAAAMRWLWAMVAGSQRTAAAPVPCVSDGPSPHPMVIDVTTITSVVPGENA
jgi:hypothetical protein